MNDYALTTTSISGLAISSLHEPATTQAKVQCSVCGGSVHNNPAALSYHAALHEPTAVHPAVLGG